jgi:hypothetical protein
VLYEDKDSNTDISDRICCFRYDHSDPNGLDLSDLCRAGKTGMVYKTGFTNLREIVFTQPVVGGTLF